MKVNLLAMSLVAFGVLGAAAEIEMWSVPPVAAEMRLADTFPEDG